MFCRNCGKAAQNDQIFCSKCGTRTNQYLQQDLSSDEKDEEKIISHYFKKGYRYKSIIMFLEEFHDIRISLSTLKRRLREYELKKNDISPDTESSIRQIIRNEITGPSSLRGYRGLWNTLRTTYQITVPRDIVMNLLREEDKEG